ncbi:hypothetical protein JN77_00295 [Salmonella enterica]|nr:hypothetical protein [Salmonella enterica]EBP3855379.1 hypothetical protein [Salmonella enterica subsp. enterica]EAW9876897.1 hypothetical protein [Salmonella enterica]EAY4926059.1 hypothetical protein [Salmonella enterica]EBA2309660.1 hypothetical protein [Salmonella enterica]
MSENNYGALMLRSALDISVDVTKITSPGIYPIIQGNINVPDASAGLLTVSLTPSKPQITFQKENSSVVYSFVNGNWEKPTATDVDALAKSQNGADIPNKPLFVQNLGLKETLNPTKRVSIGNIGTGAFDGSTPSINIGDSDSGFIGSAYGVLDVYCNNAKVGYIDNAGLHMLAGIATNGNVVLQNDAREHIIIQNADGTPRMFIYKDKGGDGVHLNNGNDGGGDYVFHKDGSFYAPLAVRAGGSKKLAVRSDNNSALSAHFNLWGDANRPTLIELDDDQGWHLFSQRNTDGSILFEVNGRIMAHTALHSGDATLATDGNVYGTVWGGWLNDWINNNLVRAVRLGPVALSGGLWRDFQLGGGQVVTGFHTDGDWEMQGGDDKVYYRPIQYLVGETWVTAPSV